MSAELVEKIARAVLYEGYILYPYRPSVKSQQRWTFGGLYPQAWTDAQTAGDPSFMTTECLLEGDASSRVRVGVRFLHLIDRTVGELDDSSRNTEEVLDSAYRIVPALTVGDSTYVPWQEAIERSVDAGEHSLEVLLRQPVMKTFSFAASHATEPLLATDGVLHGQLIREQQEVKGIVELSAVQLEDHLFKFCATIRNRTSAIVKTRDEALMHTLASTHAILHAERGEFVSLTDPPKLWKQHAGACHNVGNWPILVGIAPARETVLASPIILYDYPQIAPESPGDLFDATEIDEILSLRILTLTDAEKSAAASVDVKAKDLLARTEAAAREQLMGLHGTMRGMKPANVASQDEPQTLAAWDPFASLEDGATVDRITLDHGEEVRPGDRVRLRPLARADIFDMVLDGKIATVLSIEQDFENRVHVAVSIDDDPGQDLAATGKPGHRFFFGVDEIESVAFTQNGVTP